MAGVGRRIAPAHMRNSSCPSKHALNIEGLHPSVCAHVFCRLHTFAGRFSFDPASQNGLRALGAMLETRDQATVKNSQLSRAGSAKEQLLAVQDLARPIASSPTPVQHKPAPSPVPRLVPKAQTAIHLVVADDSKPVHRDLGLWLPKCSRVLMRAPGVQF